MSNGELGPVVPEKFKGVSLTSPFLLDWCDATTAENLPECPAREQITIGIQNRTGILREGRGAIHLEVTIRVLL